MLKNLEKPEKIEEDKFNKIVNDLAINDTKKEKTDKPINNVKVTNETLAILKVILQNKFENIIQYPLH